MALFELEGVSRIYQRAGTKKPFPALDDIGLCLSANQWVGIVGESGSGKSTLARIIAGMEAPDRGRRFFHGRDSASFTAAERRHYRRNVQMVFQSPLASFSPRLKVGVQVMEPLRNYRNMKRREAAHHAKELLQQVGLDAEFFDRRAHQFSGGQLQRAAIARAIAARPELIVFDEATSALDVTTQQKLIDLLLAMKRTHQFAVVFISHDIALVHRVTEIIHVMKDARVTERFRSADLFDAGRDAYTKLLIGAVFGMGAEATGGAKTGAPT